MSDWLPWSQPWDWARPWAFALLLVPIALALWRRVQARRQRTLALAYADADLLRYAARVMPAAARWRAFAFDALLWLLLSCAAAGPRQAIEVDAAGTPGADRASLMVLLDAGVRAAQPQAGPSALEQGRLLLDTLWPGLHGARLGLIAFGAQREGAPLQLVQLLPPTDDAAIFRHFAALAQPGLFGGEGPGASLAALLQLAQQRLGEQGQGARALLLLAAGDTPPLAAPQALALGQALHAAQQPLFVLALPGLDADRAEALRALAEASGGAMRTAPPVQTGRRVWDGIETRLAQLAAASPKRGPQTQWRELFGLFLVPALLLMLARATLGCAPRAAAPVLVLALLGTLAAPQPVHAAQSTPQAAWAAWQAGDFARAQALYAALPGFDARIGEGDAAYRRGAYAQAAQAFERALLLADTPAQRFIAFYNLGDALMHLPGKTREAVQAFDAARRIRPDDARALRNARLARRQDEIEHPSAALTGIAKRAPVIHRSRFGQQTSDTPSQLRRKPPPEGSAPLHAEARLPGQGGLAPSALPQGASTAWLPPALDWDAAEKRVQLLQDASNLLWQRRAEIDTRAARDAAAGVQR
ncbi:MAG: hypothetical protein ACP5F9_03235 [Thiomonas sp.]